MIHMRHINFKRRLVDEAGFVLPSAIIVLFVITILTGAAIAVAVQTSTSTTRDNNVKAEIAAAEAGLQVASYRLTQLEPGKTQCIGESKVETEESKCTDSPPESLGNGATFQYWTTLPLAVGAKCAGRTIATESGVTQRCVTSEGLVNNVKPGVRLQTLVKTSAGESLFPVKGFVGLEEIKVTGSVEVPALVASNGKIIGGGSANFAQGFEFCEPNGVFTPKAGAERNASGVKVHGVGGMEAQPAYEKIRPKAGCPITAPLPVGHATAESNEDSRIGVTDKLEGTFTWSEPKHELTLGAGGHLTLSGSKYYLCNAKFTSSSRLIIPVGANVEIFVDSPTDPEGVTKCGVGTGKFETGKGEFAVENLAKNPAALLIVMYGPGPFKLTNGAALEASIYAPEAEVLLEGGSGFRGGIVGKTVHLLNGTGIDEWTEGVGGLTNGKPGPYARKAWEQCTPGSGASEGC
jgi:Tfp pilus assembly protein PilX